MRRIRTSRSIFSDMQYYTVVADSYDEAERKARAMYGDGIRIHSRRDYTTGGGFLSRKRKRCEIVCYLASPSHDAAHSSEKDISEFEKEARTPDPDTLSRDERLDTEVYREKPYSKEAAAILDSNHITDPLRSRLLDGIEDGPDAPMVLAERIASTVRIDYERQVKPRHFVVFIGPTGSGKTTTLAKAAYLYSHNDRSVGIITLDTYRTGAFEQIQAFGNALSIPVISAGAEDELIKAADRFSWKDHVFIDTMGISPKDKELKVRLRGMLSMLDRDRTDFVLVISASMKEEDVMEQYAAYSDFSPSTIAITKLDETETIGNILSFADKADLPLLFFTTGQKVPDDIEKASGSVVLEHMRETGLDMKRFRAQISLQ